MTTNSAETVSVDSGVSQHPLDPLNAFEYDEVRTVLDQAAKLTTTTRFALVQLVEPAKDVVLAYRDGDAVDRQALAVLLDSNTGDVHEAVISVTHGKVLSWAQVDTSTDGQPGLLIEDVATVAEIVKSDPHWLDAMAERGITDTSLCVVLPMTPGQFAFENEQGRRVLRCATLYREKESDSPWARPVEGLIAYVDVIEREVIQLLDHGRAPLPPEHGNFSEGDWGPPRQTLKPLEITQPDGPSFVVDGQHVTWQNWSFRVGFDAREGLILHQLSYEDGECQRPIIYRASVAELVVPYGDANPARFWISYFDEGENLLGRCATSLELGCDCLGEIHYFDAALPDDFGKPYVARNVVCMHEEDYGILWKHNDFFTGVNETRRSRRLVISFFTALGNYDYGFFWYLYQDGTIQFEAKLTGIVFANAQLDGKANRHATQVAPGLVAPYHQHLFNVRLDMMVDGTENTVEEVDVVGLPTGDDNPYGNAFTTRKTVLERESVAARTANSLASRTWRVVNNRSRNRLGQPVGYSLVPHGGPTLLAQPDSPIAQRAVFATKHLWVTRADPSQRYAAGNYPNQHPGGAGLPAWQMADRALVDEDVVLWHTFGLTHVPRAEDWPIMPVEYTGFTLRPTGFFDRNPSLDLPRSVSTCPNRAHHE